MADERKFLYNDEITTLSVILDKIKGYSTSGPSFFTYDGKIRTDIAKEMQWKE